MNRRAAVALPVMLAACAGTPASVTEVIDAGTLPLPLGPALIVPDVAVTATEAERPALSALAREGLLRGIGTRPMAEPAPEPRLVALAAAQGLARVVRMTVVQATAVPAGLFGGSETVVAVHLRLIEVRTGWRSGEATFRRRSRGEAIDEAVSALAAGLLA